MEITINNNSKNIPSDSLLLQALEGLVNQDSKGIAVAVNNAVVQKAKWESFTLHEGDNIIVIKATQGG
ncbi:MAG: sulfur carrier protein ThiS [Bacteroidia bacterium]